MAAFWKLNMLIIKGFRGAVEIDPSNEGIKQITLTFNQVAYNFFLLLKPPLTGPVLTLPNQTRP